MVVSSLGGSPCFNRLPWAAPLENSGKLSKLRDWQTSLGPRSLTWPVDSFDALFCQIGVGIAVVGFADFSGLKEDNLSISK